VNSELEGYLEQLRYIRQDVAAIVAGLSDAQFNRPPAPERWSIAQCFTHLNLTAAALVPSMDKAINAAEAQGLKSAGPFVYPLFERLFVAWQEPPPRRRFRAFRAFRPAAGGAVEGVMNEFMTWQDQLEERIRRADGVDLRRARQRSPILPVVSWSLGTMFALALGHERRHIYQAKQVRLKLEAEAKETKKLRN
jgi:hypothetical protein